jgi:iron complex outermembrane receptor protein
MQHCALTTMPSFRRLKLIALLCAQFIGAGTVSADTAFPPDEQQEMELLLSLLQEQTSIATKTRLNADYVPGMVTVLRGSELEGGGARTVWDSLARVPGIELSIEESGRKQIVVRGIGRTYASGNVKIMLNGVPMNSAQTAGANPVLNLPIEQVERLEVIRGPGSAVHGEFAYAGVINVITRQDDGRLYGRLGSNAYRGGGGHASHRSEDGRFAIGLNLAGWQGDGAEVSAGNDALYLEGGCGLSGLEPCAGYSNAPGPSNEAEAGRSVILSSHYRDFSLLAQWLEDGYGDHFGINEYLPPDEKRIVTRNTRQGVELRQGFAPAEKTEAEVYFGWQENRERKDDLFIGNAGVYADSGAPYVVDSRYRERRLNGGGDLRLHAGEQHELLFAFNAAWLEATEFEQRWGQQGGMMMPFSGTITEGMNRHINSLTLQDEYRPGDSLTITAGLRHDEYSDVGASTTPRLAAVWRLSREHILKAQFAEAFRPPTFYEIGGALGAIEPSTSRTLELGYIYKGVGNEWRLSLFRTHLKDLIVFHLDPVDWWNSGYINADGARLHGAELEWEYRLGRGFDIAANFSYLQSRDDNTGEPIAGSSDWLGNLDLSYRPTHDRLFNLHYRYVSETYREPADSRPALNGYTTLDATLSLLDLWRKGVTLRLGVTNLQDADVRYPAPPDSYPGDRPRAGRQWWASVAYAF